MFDELLDDAVAELEVIDTSTEPSPTSVRTMPSAYSSVRSGAGPSMS